MQVNSARLSNLALLLMARDALSFGRDVQAVAMAVYLQRQALALEPRNPQWSLNIAAMYRRLDEIPLARAYAEATIAKDPKNLQARNILANVYDLTKEPKKALAQRLECLPIPVTPQNKEAKSEVVRTLASYFLSNNEPAKAAYLLSWWQAESGAGLSAEQRLLVQSAKRLLPQPLFDEIMAKTSGHSVEDMNAVAGKAPRKPAPVAGNDPPPPANISKVHEETNPNPTFTAQLQIKSGTKAKLMDASPGVVFDETKGTLEWTPPFSKFPEARALFLLTHADGTEETYIQTIARQ